MPLGLPRNNLPPPTSVQKTQQPPTQLKEYDLPSQLWEWPHVNIQNTEPVTAHPQDVQTQSPPQHWQIQQQHQESVQAHPLSQPRHVPDYIHEYNRLDILGTHIYQENNVIPDPYQLNMNTQRNKYLHLDLITLHPFEDQKELWEAKQADMKTLSNLYFQSVHHTSTPKLWQTSTSALKWWQTSMSTLRWCQTKWWPIRWWRTRWWETKCQCNQRCYRITRKDIKTPVPEVSKGGTA